MLKQLLQITLFGVGCLKYKTFSAHLNKAVEELVSCAMIAPNEVSIQEIEDVEAFLKEGVNNIPAIAINGKIITNGKVPSVEEIKQAIQAISNER